MPAAIYQPFLLQIGLWICLCLSFASAASQCYYPDAILQIRDTPCHPEAKHSNCCAPEDICLSNGLCYRSNINRLHRGVSSPVFAETISQLTSNHSPVLTRPSRTLHALPFAPVQMTILTAGPTSSAAHCHRSGTVAGAINHVAKAEIHLPYRMVISMIIGIRHIKSKRRSL